LDSINIPAGVMNTHTKATTLSKAAHHLGEPLLLSIIFPVVYRLLIRSSLQFRSRPHI